MSDQPPGLTPYVTVDEAPFTPSELREYGWLKDMLKSREAAGRMWAYQLGPLERLPNGKASCQLSVVRNIQLREIELQIVP